MKSGINKAAMAAACLTAATTSHAAQWLVNSPATYLHTFGEIAFVANAIDLNAAGFFAGQTVLLSRLGSFNHLGGPNPTDFGLSCVFSSSNVILPQGLLNRIPGAIAAGTPWVSPNTLIGNQTTDIAEDFQVCANAGSPNGVIMTIPVGAQYIFCTGHDNHFSDNNNTPEFYLKITPVPEVSTLWPSLCGIGLLAVLRKRRV